MYWGASTAKALPHSLSATLRVLDEGVSITSYLKNAATPFSDTTALPGSPILVYLKYLKK